MKTKFIYKEDNDIKNFLDKASINYTGIISTLSKSPIFYISLLNVYIIIRYNNKTYKTVFPFTKLYFKIKKYEKLLKMGNTYKEIKRDNILNDLL
jgi:hypothetical protein